MTTYNKLIYDFSMKMKLYLEKIYRIVEKLLINYKTGSELSSGYVLIQYKVLLL